MRRRIQLVRIVLIMLWYCSLVVTTAGLTLTTSSCAKTSPNLTPVNVVKFHATQAIVLADHIRDAAVAAHATVPPLVSAEDDVKIVTWHRSAIKIIHDSPGGWKPAVNSILDELMKDLSPTAAAAIQPYVTAYRLVIQEVG